MFRNGKFGKAFADMNGLGDSRHHLKMSLSDERRLARQFVFMTLPGMRRVEIQTWYPSKTD